MAIGRFNGAATIKICRRLTIDLRCAFKMHSEKLSPVIHGENGISQKARLHAGQASHYISLTRLATSGTLEVNGQKLAVTGVAWMDHEFFTDQLEASQAGWDWLEYPTR